MIAGGDGPSRNRRMGDDLFQTGTFIGASGFKNVAPRSRLQRLAKMDKESLEKGRLQNRYGGTYAKQTRNQDFPGRNESHTSCASSGAGYLPDSDRFTTGGFDIVSEFKNEHDGAVMRSEMVRDNRREASMLRDETRWSRLDAQSQAEKEKWTRERAEGTKAKRNAGSVPFDLVTLNYVPGAAGQQLQAHDQVVRYRSAARAQNLQNRMNSAGYNPVTGADQAAFVMPPKPGGNMHHHYMAQ